MKRGGMRGTRAAAALAFGLPFVLASVGPCVATAPGAATAHSATAHGAVPRVTLSARFVPDRLGRSTTVHWGFRISEPTPLRSLELRLPAGMGFAASSLGLEACAPERLLEAGPRGCPANSRLGFGTALAEVPAETVVRERARVTVLLGPPPPDGMTVLFFVEGSSPVRREIVLVSSLSQLTSPQGASLLTQVPPLPAWTDGPDIGLLRLDATIGPQGLTYHRRVHGHTIAFVPRGVSVPERCPRGGFAMSATFGWWTLAATTTATTRVPCPRAAARASAGE